MVNKESRKNEITSKAKKSYQSPRLSIHGDIASITGGGGGKKADPMDKKAGAPVTT